MVEEIPRQRYPSYNTSYGEGCGDVDSSTELWDEEDQDHCSTCSSKLHDQYTSTLRVKIRDQQHAMSELKKTVNSLEADKLKEVELRRQLRESEVVAQEQSTEIGRLEALVEELDQLVQENEDQ